MTKQLHRCETVDPQIADLFPVLAEMISRISIKDQIPALEVAIGNNCSASLLDPC